MPSHRRKGEQCKLVLSNEGNGTSPSIYTVRLQWEFSIIILPSMPYVFVYEDWFVGVMGVLILSLLVLRYMIARKRD